MATGKTPTRQQSARGKRRSPRMADLKADLKARPVKAGAAGGGTGKVQFQDFQFAKRCD